MVFELPKRETELKREGEVFQVLTEVVPFFNADGSIAEFKVLRSFRVNTPKKEKLKEKTLIDIVERPQDEL